MPKYYVIPIDIAHNAYLGVRAQNNPYTGGINWCAGTPNVFGGNAQGSMLNTIYNEAREESHFKIDITQINLALGGVGANFQNIHHNAGFGGMTFYAVRNEFQHNPAPYFPPILANQNKYRECTGEIVRINLMLVNAAHKTTTAGDVLRAFQAQHGPRIIPAQASSQFLNSEMAEAIRRAAIRVQGYTL